MQVGSHSGTSRRGFIIGELLLAVLLLAVAVSSLAALMYSVSRHSESKTESACTDRGIAESACTAHVNAGGGPKLLRSDCVAKGGKRVRGCGDSLIDSGAPAKTIVKSRTDSVSLSLVAKKPKSSGSRMRRLWGLIH